MKIYWSEAYCASRYAFDTTRKSEYIAESLREFPIAGVEVVAPRSLTFEEIAEVHAPEYVRAVQTGAPIHLAESNGITWDPNVWEMVCASNGGVVAAAIDALENRVSGSLSSGLHHAHYGCGTAFCTFNGLVLAAHAALRRGLARVLIIDFDAHYGDGTAAMIAGNPAMAMVSPSLRRMNKPADPGKEYLDLCARALESVDGKFDLAIYNAGMDPHEDCRLGGSPGITTQVLAERERMVFEFCHAVGLPVCFVLAGGYISEKISRETLTHLHRLTIETAAKYAKVH